jgi:hypothetical protein
MKKVVKLNESDLERLVQRIIREEGEESQQGQESEGQTDKPNPKDVEEFMGAFKERFLKKFPQYSKKISNKEERIMLVKSFADMLGISPGELGSAKTKM